ncbi:MAG: tyrosine-type recombinase/integrase [Actinomycetia bacterium]|nr:tyrosine-type recombinase/integrase [Actinomycetes bacterium]
MKVLRTSRTNSEACEGRQESVEDTKHGDPGWRASRLVRVHARLSGQDRPIFLNHDGARRHDRHASARIMRRLAKRAGIDKRISPHSLRHSFITAALDAGVPLRDVQEAASHADPRTTMRYDRGRESLDRHATYIASTFVAGASR